jgi:ATP-dependent RNA helicase RhlE
MGFINDVKRIIAALPIERQTLLFSATISPEIRALASRFLRNPETVAAGERRNPAETITQHFYSAPKDGKIDLLIHAIEAERMESVLVFSRTKHGADKISRRLDRKGIKSMAIHSNRTQSQRQRALDGFKQGQFQVLVATDIAARGIDVEGISHVINYDIPHYAEDYIHRIGRTGRAGLTGDAITFVARDDQQHLRKIEQFIGKKLPLKTYPGFTAPVPEPSQHQATSTIPRPRPHHGPPKHSDKPRHPEKAKHPDKASGHHSQPKHRTERGQSKEGAWSNQPHFRGRKRRRVS